MKTNAYPIKDITYLFSNNLLYTIINNDYNV